MHEFGLSGHTRGVGDDAIKAILAGVDMVQMVSALLRHGPGVYCGHASSLEQWMGWNTIARLDEMRGRSSL